VKKLLANLISWVNITGNGSKAFWGSTALIFLALLLRPAVSNEEIFQKILLLLSSPLITLFVFGSVWGIWIFWTEIVSPLVLFLKKGVKAISSK